jgi:hypothetical protein
MASIVADETAVKETVGTISGNEFVSAGVCPAERFGPL